MMYSASETARRASAAARNTCTTMQTTEDPDEKWPNTSAETRDAYRSTQNFLSGASSCGLPLGDTPVYFCPMHACCKIEEFIENGPPKKKGGRRPKAAAAAAAAGPSSAPVPDEESEEDEDDM